MKTNTNVLIACVAENNEEHYIKCKILFKSLRRFGGCLAKSAAVVCFVNSIRPEYQKAFQEMDVEVEIIKPFNTQYPHTNNLRIFEIQKKYDYLIVLDNDIVIARDFSSYISSSHVLAKIDYHDYLSLFSLEDYMQLFKYFNLEMPSKTYNTESHDKLTYPHYNVGVMIIPKIYVDIIRKEWANCINDLIRVYPKLKTIEKQSYYTDEIAFSLMLQKTKIPIEPLPISMNFQTAYPIHPYYNPDEIDPYIIHHHDRIDKQGKLLLSNYKKANEVILKINEIL
ncbi:hypothetical protein A7K93_00385 [Candidatus Methylacidiphilum fumarolicum]|uniref:Glycosyl transferase n=2 Tax=Candidatus Methylacidiphilum fumarolicum TaxID=591154 RepID=I0K131_METFB|nr:hypothetical protein [Candidatus Methylacidiphilum fumarolicum]MBW6413933.1 hypothetical protein [Candidatus Methylacidiphilum fumarolicum]TFE70482.1 hypothetical protein A7K73_03365 [Candidatus Methylacidiphilum fumarolicum]TFE74800.1 hypothetical protein A7K72_03350 [Candidatus Methylacidiphilum fumarolicum]TFE76046.1 hypothetical protein A7K93_00385 [Candidatus Methylacidiphilum fumarolicum]TFE76370.1 hypothetical protein A7D33_00555 [Candidatus Methylacidiphilum fumarolicum]